MPDRLTVSVVIPTYRRPQYVEECLAHLARLRTRPLEVLVVDASPDDTTRRVVAAAGARYLRNELGAGTTPESRGIGVDSAQGDVVAFVDDDAYVDPDWLDELLAPYEDPEVVGVGGRIVNGQPGEDRQGLDRIGRLLPDGRLTGYFAADPGRPVAVDHLLGATMSYRRRALLDVGGVYGRYPGPCVCEETDIALRQRALGRRLVFTPRAVVRHVSAPYAGKGERFDRRWYFYERRNRLAMFIRIFGPGDPIVRRHGWTVLRDGWQRCRWAVRALAGRVRGDDGRPLTAAQRLRAPAVVVVRAALNAAGFAAGWSAGLRDARLDRRRREERSLALTSGAGAAAAGAGSPAVAVDSPEVADLAAGRRP